MLYVCVHVYIYVCTYKSGFVTILCNIMNKRYEQMATSSAGPFIFRQICPHALISACVGGRTNGVLSNRVLNERVTVSVCFECEKETIW